MSTNPAPTSSAQSPGKSPKRAAVGAWIGSALEYYDFFVYATAASIVFPKIFFPQADPAVGVIGSLATFGVGYVARPLGAIFMGWWGDTRGRKSVLVLTLWIMGISTFLVGCLPTYSQIGVWAPILLVALRLAQGIGVSGEQAGANAMVLEHAPDHRRAFYTSFTLNGTQGGQIISTAIFLPLAASMSDEALLAYGWRIPFWLSALVMIVAYLIRRNIDETPTFREVVEKDVDRVSPLVEAFRGHKANMLRVILMCFINSVSVTLGIFALAFATNAAYGNSLSTTAMLWVGVLVNVIAVIAIPLWALLADAVGRRPVFIFAGLSCAVLMSAVPPLHRRPEHRHGVRGRALDVRRVLQRLQRDVPRVLQRAVPPRLRVTAVAVSTQVGFGLTGFLPTLAAVLAPPGSNVVLIVGTLVTVCCIISAAAVFVPGDRRRAAGPARPAGGRGAARGRGLRRRLTLVRDVGFGRRAARHPTRAGRTPGARLAPAKVWGHWSAGAPGRRAAGAREPRGNSGRSGTDWRSRTAGTPPGSPYRHRRSCPLPAATGAGSTSPPARVRRAARHSLESWAGETCEARASTATGGTDTPPFAQFRPTKSANRRSGSGRCS